MGVRKVKFPERSFILRLPEDQASAINDLVEKGLAKSNNELIVKIIAAFLSDLRKWASENDKKRE